MILDNEVKSSTYIIIEIVAFMLSAICSSLEYNTAASTVLILAGLFIFYSLSRFTKNFLNSRGLFLLVWNVTIGLSCLKLHPSQGTWEVGTWTCFMLAALFFLFGYDCGISLKGKKTRVIVSKVSKITMFTTLCGIIILVFIVEVYFSGGVPLFSSSMSSYATFGLPYLHYITVTSATIPAIGVALFNNQDITKSTKRVVIFFSLICALIPFALVSRQLILQMVIVFGVSYFKIHGLRKIKIKYVVGAGIALVVVWMFATGKRNQSDAYLSYALNLNSPVNARLYQLYLYITYNYDIFNDNLNTAAFSTLGFKSLNPLWTLIGVKNLWPESIVNFDHIKSIRVFTTARLVFTPYCDFGILGIVVYCFIVGFYVQRVEHKANFYSDRVYVVKKSIVDYCLVMSFFTCFFSNTMIWVQLIVLTLVSLFCNTTDFASLYGIIRRENLARFLQFKR